MAYFRNRFLKTVHVASHQHVVTCQSIDGRDVITGYAEWLRKRTGDKENIADSTTAGEIGVRTRLHGHQIDKTADASDNRAADPAYADVFERASVFTHGYWTGARAESWYLDLLMVDPSHQRKGFGRALVQYGLALADTEGVCASLIASEAGDGLYASCGFKAVGRMQEGEGNPLQGMPGGRIFFREPQRLNR